MYSSNWIVEDLGVDFAETSVRDDIFSVTRRKLKLIKKEKDLRNNFVTKKSNKLSICVKCTYISVADI